MTSFDEDALKGAVERYKREYDRYLKLCARVADICRDLVDANAIRAQVTSRAKTPKSFEGKLRRIVAGKKKPLTDIDSVFVHVRDLAAVRVATYEARHEAKVVELLSQRFQSSSGTAPVPEAKDYQQDPARRDNFYRATHVEVCLQPADLVGTYANVAAVPCEIQVCSMMAHVWNEIEHDLAYKPFSGTLSDFEKLKLKHLGNHVRMADDFISELLKATDERLAAETTPFSDVYDFVARLRPWFPGIDFGKNAGPLFEALRPLRLLTPESIRRQIDLPDPILAGAQARCESLRERSPTLFGALCDSNSSDLLLVALLPKVAHLFGRTALLDERLALLARAYVADLQQREAERTGEPIRPPRRLAPPRAGAPSPTGVAAPAIATATATAEIAGASAAPPASRTGEQALPDRTAAGAPTHAETPTPDEVIHRIITVYLAGLKRCHKRLLQRDPTARGRVNLHFWVNTDGTVLQPEAIGFHPDLDHCIAAEMRNWSFPVPRAADGRPTTAKFSVHLQLVPE